MKESLKQEAATAHARWMKKARCGDFSGPTPPSDVFAHAGVTENPRLSDAYRDAVVEELGLNDAARYPHLGEQDLAAAKEVFRRCAPGLWRKDTPSTIVRHMLHDVVTIGGPVRGAPLRLKGEAAEFVEEAVAELVRTGVYEKGASPWGSLGLSNAAADAPRRAGRSGEWSSTTGW